MPYLPGTMNPISTATCLPHSTLNHLSQPAIPPEDKRTRPKSNIAISSNNASQVQTVKGTGANHVTGTGANQVTGTGAKKVTGTGAN